MMGEDQKRSEQSATQPTCPRCGSPRWVSVSLNGGYTRVAQCVPCGAYRPGTIGPGWRSPRFGDPDAEYPAYRAGHKASEVARGQHTQDGAR